MNIDSNKRTLKRLRLLSVRISDPIVTALEAAKRRLAHGAGIAAAMGQRHSGHDSAIIP